jgi:hypothetical protein
MPANLYDELFLESKKGAQVVDSTYLVDRGIIIRTLSQRDRDGGIPVSHKRDRRKQSHQAPVPILCERRAVGNTQVKAAISRQIGLLHTSNG